MNNTENFDEGDTQVAPPGEFKPEFNLSEKIEEFERDEKGEMDGK